MHPKQAQVNLQHFNQALDTTKRLPKFKKIHYCYQAVTHLIVCIKMTFCGLYENGILELV